MVIAVKPFDLRGIITWQVEQFFREIDLDKSAYLETTPKALTVAEAMLLATNQRLDRYMSGYNSDSMIDHYYDKLLHLAKFETNNKYLAETRDSRVKPLLDVVIKYSIESHIEIEPLLTFGLDSDD